MFRPSTAALALLLIASTASTASAQSAPVGTGSRVRVTTAQGPLIGIVRSVGNGSIAIIDRSGDSILVERSDIRSIELSQGWKSNGRRGAERGAGAGLLMGVALGALVGSDGDRTGTRGSETFENLETYGRAMAYGVAGLVAGGVIGYAVGLRSQSEEWAAADLDRPIAFASPGRIGVRLSF
jgi:hypothetical protein